jgi:hypothetical protein
MLTERIIIAGENKVMIKEVGLVTYYSEWAKLIRAVYLAMSISFVESRK